MGVALPGRQALVPAENPRRRIGQFLAGGDVKSIVKTSKDSLLRIMRAGTQP